MFSETLEYAKKFDFEYARALEENKEDMEKFLSIEKDSDRPRKDISKYSDVKEEFSYAIDELFYKENYSKYEGDKIFSVSLIKDYVLNVLDLEVSNDEWFNDIKEFALKNGYASSPKEYKQNPDNFKGHVGDICEALRVMVTGRTKSPDLFSIVKILGKNRVLDRINRYEKFIEK